MDSHYTDRYNIAIHNYVYVQIHNLICDLNNGKLNFAYELDAIILLMYMYTST